MVIKVINFCLYIIVEYTMGLGEGQMMWRTIKRREEKLNREVISEYTDFDIVFIERGYSSNI